MYGHLALDKALKLDAHTVLDVGSGNGDHARAFAAAGFQVTTVDIKNADICGDFMTVEVPKVDLVWSSHVLEHMPNPNLFLRKCFDTLNDDGWLCVTVPPLKHEIVGGHVNLYNAGLLLYQIILAGFDCSQAMVKEYGYNISVIVRKKPARMPLLNYDNGDIEKLARYFPMRATQGFDGRLGEVNWTE